MPTETMEAMASTQIPAQEVNLELEQAAYAGSDFTFLWLEIARKCNLSCVHCYAESSPSATSGLMTKEMWQSVIDQAQQMGVKHVQFIGGEPTIHPDFHDLLVWAAQRGMSIEVYSNLTHIKPPLWNLFNPARNKRMAGFRHTLDPAAVKCDPTPCDPETCGPSHRPCPPNCHPTI